MTKIIKQIDILDKVSTTLKTEFKSTVYSDEVLEGFDKPCFFIKCLCTNIPQTKNITKKKISIIMTYFPKNKDRNEIHYADIMDKLQYLFQHEIRVNERYLHINDFYIERIGEEQDIIQATLKIEYMERIMRPHKHHEIMEDMQLKMRINEGEKAIWQS